MQNATARSTGGGKRGSETRRRVPNQLIVRLKPGADIDAWARLLNAKIIGRIPELTPTSSNSRMRRRSAARAQLGNGTDGGRGLQLLPGAAGSSADCRRIHAAAVAAIQTARQFRRVVVGLVLRCSRWAAALTHSC
jgi:hypothetical protein